MSVRTAYLAAEGFAQELEYELGAVELRHGRLLIAAGLLRPAAWAANVWLDPREVSAKALAFGTAPPAAPLGSWTLLGAETMLAAAQCMSPFPHGEIGFVEDRVGPPSRAYLKLWEALTPIGRRPGPGEICLDFGSSPGAGVGHCSKWGRMSSASTRRLWHRKSRACPGSSTGVRAPLRSTRM